MVMLISLLLIFLMIPETEHSCRYCNSIERLFTASTNSALSNKSTKRRLQKKQKRLQTRSRSFYSLQFNKKIRFYIASLLYFLKYSLLKRRRPIFFVMLFARRAVLLSGSLQKSGWACPRNRRHLSDCSRYNGGKRSVRLRDS
jgi:hypothetical protein